MLPSMARRHFLKLVSSVPLGFLAACAPRTAGLGAEAPATRGTQIRGICFDLFTLFDPRSVISVADSLFPGRGTELCAAWRTRQFEYSWLRVAAGRYQDFEAVTDEALRYAATEARLSLNSAARARLVAAYSELEPWPDARPQLTAFKAAGLKLAPLANYSPKMLERLIDNAGFAEHFDALISTDAARTYKPDPRAYALGPEQLALRREQIAFSAFGGWDAAGARWFGFKSFWVNRLGVTPESLAPSPHGTGPSLAELADFVATTRDA